VVPVIELIAVVLLPTVAVYALLGGFRLMRWAAQRRSLRRPRPWADRADRRNLRTAHELEATETRTDLPVKSVRLRELRGAYLTR
jgi:hypothetical protein